jgi:putative NIF3 family GTP cyclohydrolase 1 type 2
MRSKKMKHKKRQRYHLVGGNFIDNMSTKISDTFNNNSLVKGVNGYFSQTNNSMSLDSLKQSLTSTLENLKYNVVTRTKQRIQGIICNSGGSKRRKKHLTRKKQILHY